MSKITDTIKSLFTKKTVSDTPQQVVQKTIQPIEVEVTEQNVAQEIVKPVEIDENGQIKDLTPPGTILDVYQPKMHIIYTKMYNNHADQSVFSRIKEPRFGDMAVLLKDMDTVFGVFMKKKNGWEQI